MPNLFAVYGLAVGVFYPAVAADFAQAGADCGLSVGLFESAPALALDVAQGAGFSVAHYRDDAPHLGRNG